MKKYIIKLLLFTFIIIICSYCKPPEKEYGVVIDPDGDIYFVSIAVDSNNKAHISYNKYDEVNDIYSLMYITNVTGSWVTETLDSGDGIGYHASIGIDSNDKVHISYIDNTKVYLKYVTNKTGSWVIETLDTIECDESSLVVDSFNKVHIVYYRTRNSPQGVMHVTNESGSWVIESIYSFSDNEDRRDHELSVAIDKYDFLHVSYSDFIDPDVHLKYATNKLGFWQNESINSDGHLHPDIAVDSNNKIYISRFNSLGYLNCISGEYGSWNDINIDFIGGEYANWSSIYVDNNNKVHVSYTHNKDNNNLFKYATNKTGSWINDIIYEDKYNSSNSITIGSNNKVHLCYTGKNNILIYYAFSDLNSK